MSSNAQVETGLQLLARLNSRPSLCNLDNTLFPNGLRYKETVEINGNVSSGKTLLLTQLLTKCLMPSKCQEIFIKGLGVSAILINTDHHFQVTKLAALMSSHIIDTYASNNVQRPDDKVVNAIIAYSLDHLTIINCYDSAQLFFTLHSLENILLHNDKIALLAIDSISAYYWQDRERGGFWRMDLYTKNLIKLIQRNTFQFNIVTIYTKPSDFVSKGRDFIDCVSEPTIERINYRIQLYVEEKTNKFSALIKSATDEKKVDYEILDDGIKWVIGDNKD